MKDWAGPTAFALAVGLAVGFAGTLIIMAGPWKATEGLGAATGYLLSTIGGAMAGAVATFLGMRYRNGGNHE